MLAEIDSIPEELDIAALVEVGALKRTPTAGRRWSTPHPQVLLTLRPQARRGPLQHAQGTSEAMCQSAFPDYFFAYALSLSGTRTRYIGTCRRGVSMQRNI
ncbi:MAG TPA: hypothetical protein VKU38_20220 [Ktedonobacteraceae bacterium]|nr:hypothetical protein [Ktedonobacteraceae bacterium]